jgi:hypothetical protein
MSARDTSTEARAIQIEARRALSPGDRVAMGLGHMDQMVRILGAGVRGRHPGYSESDVEWAVRRHLVGDHLFVRAWPDAPLIDP